MSATRIIVKRVGEEPSEETMEMDLDTMQGLVSGYVERWQVQQTDPDGEETRFVFMWRANNARNRVVGSCSARIARNSVGN